MSNQGDTLPFFLTNEHVEVIIEDNPDDIFTPSDMNQNPSIQKTTIRQLVLKEIEEMLKSHALKAVVIKDTFCKADLLKDDVY